MAVNSRCEHGVALLCIPGVDDFFQVGEHLGLPLAECVEDRGCSPHENSAVPIVFARVDVLLGGGGVGFFFELLYAIRRGGRGSWPSLVRRLGGSLALPQFARRGGCTRKSPPGTSA